MLLLALLIGLPFQPQPCSWPLQGTTDALMPTGATIPLNASFWVRDWSTSSTIAVFAPNGPIAVDYLVTELTATGGRLVQLRPKELLAPDTIYELQAGYYRTPLTTTSTVDTARPAVPIITRVVPINSSQFVCETAGVIIDVADPGEAVIHLIEDPADGSIYEVGVSGYYLPFNRAVPTDPNASIRFRMVAVDLAGNRSDPTPAMDAMAGDVARASPNAGVRFHDSGCTHTDVDTSASPLLPFLALALFRLGRSSSS